MTKSRAIFELCIAAALWGFGFSSNELALQTIPSMDLLAYRFMVAALAGEAIRAIFFRKAAPFNKSDMMKALPAGLLLSVFLIFQTIGMEFTTATNSGFLTILYVIFVPLFNDLIFKTRTPLKVYGMAALALIGAFVLMGHSFSNFNKGDVWTLGCAGIGAFHIIYLGRISPKVKDVVRFNNWQSVFCLLPILPFWLYKPANPMEFSQISWGGVLYLAIFSSAIAFFLQVRAQRVLSDTTAGMLCLLESPFAFIFAFLILGETLNFVAASGAILILISSFLTILWDSPEYSKSKSSQ